MGAIGLNPIRLDRIGLDPIRINAIKLGVPGASGTDRPYIDPEVLASLKAVCICYGKSNDDPDRAVVKNLVDPDNPFVISNAAFKLNSGFGEYEQDFTDWKKSPKVTSFDSESIKFTSDVSWVLLYHPSGIGEDIPSFKVRIKLYGEGTLYYNYITQEGTYTNVAVKSEIFETPICYNTKYTGEKRVNVGFTLGVISGECSGTIEQIPSFEGAFVTDGIDDLITSTKTVQEMLGGSNEITVVSLITHISGTGKYNIIGDGGIQVSDYSGQTFMAGTSSSGEKIVELGDKEKLQAVQYTTFDSKLTIGLEDSSYAYYGTFVFNKENVPVDWIHQVIAYFNLDRTLKPDILCNTIKQGITNENHAEFGDKLIDFSGNGRDIQLNNIAWKGDSGIGKYEVDFASLDYNNATSVFTATYKSCSISKIIKDGVGNIFYNWGQTLAAINSTKIQVIGLDEIGAILEFMYLDESGNSTTKQYSTDGIYDLPASAAYQGDSHNTNFRISIRGYIGDCDITITQIPSHAGALYLDGINDFGKVTGMPVYKDYTVVTDREIFANTGAISSKNNPGAFVETAGNSVYSFGQATSGLNFISTRSISYLSKYSYCGQSITAGAAEDGTDMWLGTIRDNDTRFFNGAIYSLMTFPYSMSEFLIERQLKKHKLGTLYPDMVEWRPIIKSNVEYASISYLLRIPGQGTVTPVIGQYYPILSTDTSLVVYVATNGVDEVANLTINGQEPTSSSIHVDGRFKFEFPFNNSPQKINITIDEYIRYEDIVQPYPSFVKLENLDRTYTYTWGDKLKVGDTIRYNSSVNLLEGAYTLKGQLECNGVYVYDNNQYITVAKEMIFAWTNSPIWSIDDNEPKCILSPRLLRIPNSSYKILGYIPDISGHGNHGKINNSAYAEGSGVNEDGSYQFDGVDDFITIPTTVGGKQVLMKVNWQSIAGTAILYDQRTNGGFAIFNRDFDTNENKVPAYRARNIGGSTYIDGILNKYIYASELKNITHNIVELHDPKLNIGTLNPKIGSSYLNSNYTQMSLYDFMLFDEISTDDKIKELNKYVGIEGNVWGILTQLSNSTLISNETLIKNE
jgi:hypothetical protein